MRPNTDLKRSALDMIKANPILIGLIFLTFAIFIYYLLENLRNLIFIPYMDGVGVFDFLYARKDVLDIWPRWTEYFNFIDNEHKTIFPFLIWQFDFLFFGGPAEFTFIVQYSLCLLISLFLTRMFNVKMNGISLIAVAGGVLCLMFMTGHYQNLLWWKQLHVYMACSTAVAALWLCCKVTRENQSNQYHIILAVGALSYVSSFSFGYGMVVWPLLIAHAILTRWRVNQIILLLAFAAAFAITLWAYPIPQTPHHGSRLDNILNTPFALLNYWFIQIGSSFRPLMQIIMGDSARIGMAIIGFLMLMLALLAAWSSYLGQNRGQARDQFAVLVFGFGAACALITAISRVNLNSAIDSRYLIIPTICLIASMYLISVPRIKNFGFKLTNTKYAMTLSVLCIVISVSFYNFGKSGLNLVKNVNFTGPLTAELKLADIFPIMLPPVGASRINDSTWPTFVLHSKQKGELLAFGLQGEAITDVFKAKNHSCPGFLDKIEKVDGTDDVFKINGWSRFSEDGSEAASHILVVHNGIVSGIGAVSLERPDVKNALIESGVNSNASKLERSGFEGYVRVPEGSEIEIRGFYAGKICEVAGNTKFTIR